jgi:hypothetical protein
VTDKLADKGFLANFGDLMQSNKSVRSVQTYSGIGRTVMIFVGAGFACAHKNHDKIWQLNGAFCSKLGICN